MKIKNLNRILLTTGLVIVLALLLTKTSYGQLEFQDGTMIIQRGKLMPVPRSYMRKLFSVDPIEGSILNNTWEEPILGGKVVFSDTTIVWETISVDEEGWFKGSELRGAWIYTSVESKDEKVVLLEGMGHNMVYINGVPRMGNKYQSKEKYEDWEPKFNFSLLPVKLRKGKNNFLFYITRGRLKLVFHEPESELLLNVKDNTLPDLIVGESLDSWGAVVIVNAGNKAQKNLLISTSGDGLEKTKYPVPIIQPYSIRKVAFKISAPAISQKRKLGIRLELHDSDMPSARPIVADSIFLRVLDMGDTHKKTFRSSIDNSVQYFAVNPVKDKKIQGSPALVLSVHGANVEAINQAGSYNHKSWANIVSPTNRRPYGYDWEDWGRIDALEVLKIAQESLEYDPERVYLTGHSMGGHGTWILGATYPDKFAAIGPSAGWISWWSYTMGGIDKDTSKMGLMLSKAELPLKTFELEQNFKHQGVYIIHGDEDRSVPVGQARLMVEHLETFHHDFMYHEQPDAGHWWDVSEEPGTDCVDWQPMFDFFARHSLPGKERIRKIDFSTANPGVSSSSNWLTIHSQIKPLEISSADVQFDPGQNLFFGNTENVSILGLDLVQVDREKSVMISLDGLDLKIEKEKLIKDKIWLNWQNNKWELKSKPLYRNKGPHRNGTFKDAFNHNMVFVLGTQGNKAEDKWAMEKARYDAETFWYQGNGSIDIILDTDFDPAKYPDRNVILYGNESTNTAWKVLLSECPIKVTKKLIQVGNKSLKGKDLGILFTYPRKDSEVASVGVVTGTGTTGARLLTNLPYLLPGNGFPDCLILSSEFIEKEKNGINMAGYFGNDWQVNTGDFIWK